MPKYRKKPVVIEAVQILGGSVDDVPWLREAFALGTKPGGVMGFEGGVLRIYTLEGVMTAEHGDWIIQGVKGEIYSCKDEIFQVTYEAAEET